MEIKRHNSKSLILVFFLIFNCLYSNSQVVIGNKDKIPEPFSALEIESTDGGLRLPRLRYAEKYSLPLAGNPMSGKGLILFDNTLASISYYTGLTGNPWFVYEPIVGANIFSSDILFTNNLNATRQDVTVGIKDRAITLSKLQGGIDASGYNQFYATDELGKAVFIPQTGNTSTLEANNGLNASESSIGLGGTLAHETSLDLVDKNLRLTSTGGKLTVAGNGLVVDPSTNRVGVGIDNPRVNLDINGPLATGDTSIVVSSIVKIPDGYGQVLLTGNFGEDFTISLPPGVAGERLILLNDTKQVGYHDLNSDYTISPGEAMELVYSDEVWRATHAQLETVILDMYNGQARVPPYFREKDSYNVPDWNYYVNPAGRNSTYDTDDWYIMSKTSRFDGGNKIADGRTASELILIQYKHDPFELDNICPMISTNNQREDSYDTYCAMLTGMNNNGVDPVNGTTGRTQFLVNVCRTDFFANAGSQWAGESNMLNIMLINTKKILIPSVK